MARKRKSNKSSTQRDGENVGRFSYQGLDRVIHEKARLGILASLAAHHSGLLFNDLKQLCSLTDGNLSRHLTVLTEGGLVETFKGSNGSRPQTLIRLTTDGRQRFADYISELENVIADTQSQLQSETVQQRWSGGWSPT